MKTKIVSIIAIIVLSFILGQYLLIAIQYVFLDDASQNMEWAAHTMLERNYFFGLMILFTVLCFSVLFLHYHIKGEPEYKDKTYLFMPIGGISFSVTCIVSLILWSNGIKFFVFDLWLFEGHGTATFGTLTGLLVLSLCWTKP